MFSCQGFGAYDTVNYDFANAFHSCGATAVVGFHNTVFEEYAYSIFTEFTNNMLKGSSARESLNKSIELYGENDIEYGTVFFPQSEYWKKVDPKIGRTWEESLKNHTVAAYPVLSEMSYMLSGTIKDKTTNTPIGNGSVLLCLIEKGTTVAEYNCSTDKNGQFSINLPAGTYNYTINKMDLFDELYETATGTITVVGDKENSLGTIYLTSKNGVVTATISGTVKDKTTGNAISGVTVKFVDNESDSLDPVATAMTDENGLFSVKLPYGSYSISFNHDNYEYYGTTVNVDTENIVLTNPILLTPKNSIGGVEVATFLGKNISEVIKEYGNNYVEESIEGGHYYVYNNLLAFGITENAYAGLEPKNVVSISAVTTNVNLYQDFSSDMSYNDLIALVPDVEKPQCFYNELTNEYMYSSTFTYENYLFAYFWNEYSSDNDICYQASVMFAPDYEQRTIVDSGDCGADGDNVKWTLYDDGELVISGSGSMADYQDWKDIPWHNVRGQIKSVIIKNGIKRIGSYSFGNCSNLQNITIGENVECIGEMSLSATSLKNIIIPDSVKSIEKSAFFGCSYLESVILGKNVAIIGQMAFQRCEKLVSITIPESLSSIGSQAFYKCDNLKNVYYLGTSTNWANISIGSYNTCLTSATIHYNS